MHLGDDIGVLTPQQWKCTNGHWLTHEWTLFSTCDTCVRTCYLREFSYWSDVFGFTEDVGNQENRVYNKSQCYAPLLKYSSLRLLLAKAVCTKQVLQQGDSKNAFCNSKLPEDKLTGLCHHSATLQMNYFLVFRHSFQLATTHWWALICFIHPISLPWILRYVFCYRQVQSSS